MRNKALEIGALLNKKGLRLTIAESCTGGLLSHLITDIPGSSAYFLGAVVVYSNHAKKQLLGVRSETLELYGAVSHETVAEMALNACSLFAHHPPDHKTVGLAVSGIAGPGGGTADKPVGLVWIGISLAGKTYTRQYFHQGTRSENKESFAEKALALLLNHLMTL